MSSNSPMRIRPPTIMRINRVGVPRYFWADRLPKPEDNRNPPIVTAAALIGSPTQWVNRERKVISRSM